MLLLSGFISSGNDGARRSQTSFGRGTPDTVGVGNVGDNSVSSYRLHASETQQLTCSDD